MTCLNISSTQTFANWLIAVLYLFFFVCTVWRKTKPDDPNDTHTGWVFSDPDGKPFANSIDLGGPFSSSYPENNPDPYLEAKTVRDIYERLGMWMESTLYQFCLTRS